ncbi:hypothetical protein HYH03_006719 [Edaphochlamys debaryana]|uniref:alanine--glyoxylate transaminase n=1 Tax=Edaphochlamys debaryana TaxID=47281 RepID=A0A835YCR0_9CHLO|nr:hypothetical protein HYH03_006719 [Edaphochlamys debaryana]|eukprot:KAG2495109.1 hypothetical protein HYH03_006719 [Edaphochlamys debaryana]
MKNAQKLVAPLLEAAQSAGATRGFVAPARWAARASEEIVAVDNTHKQAQSVISVPSRLLMGPGPANAHPRVLNAQALPLLGHMHPPFLHIMDEMSEGLRYALQTKSKYTLMISGTGHAGMEAAIANLVEPGDKVLVGNAGIWGERVGILSRRYNADVVEIKCPTGETFSYADLKKAVETHKPKVLFLCQGESSTGTHQSLAGVGELCRANGTLLLVDTVCSLGGVPLFADAWGVDCIYSGSQKCLSGPPGAAPFFMSERAMEKLAKRKTPPATYNLDLNLIGDYWGWWNKRSYHHTGPVSTFYAMREALQIVAEEGLEPMWARHQEMHHRLWDGLRSLGLKPFVEKEEHRLITVNTIKVPEGVDWAKVVKHAMDEYSLEIAGGLGPTAGKVWRIGIMGFNAKPQNVDLVIDAFRAGLKQQGKL